MHEEIQLSGWARIKHHEVKIKIPPEKPPARVYQRSSATTSLTGEKIYSDGEYLYRVAPFFLPEKDHFCCMVAVTSFLYFGLAKYDKATGQRLDVLYSHTDRAEVERWLEANRPDLKLVDNPKLLYNLRITHGYGY